MCLILSFEGVGFSCVFFNLFFYSFVVVVCVSFDFCLFCFSSIFFGLRPNSH